MGSPKRDYSAAVAECGAPDIISRKHPQQSAAPSGYYYPAPSIIIAICWYLTYVRRSPMRTFYPLAIDFVYTQHRESHYHIYSGAVASRRLLRSPKTYAADICFAATYRSIGLRTRH